MDLLTQDQAATKWCPFARCGNAAGCNRNGISFPLDPICITAACMSWVWYDDENEHRTTYADEGGTPPAPSEGGWVAVGPSATSDWSERVYQDWTRKNASRRGYCSLMSREG